MKTLLKVLKSNGLSLKNVSLTELTENEIHVSINQSFGHCREYVYFCNEKKLIEYFRYLIQNKKSLY